ncbi:T9SS type A sorting domain-containing protein [Bacteroidales bacterium OttesenSCG-928-I21]|nr:T9SS type A sorting domain-containing protein [Bacteroidales bacterium OttesenSCG-928-I21]
MKRLLFVVCILIIARQTAAQDLICLTWEAGTSEKTIYVRATTDTENISVNWGDGIIENFDVGGMPHYSINLSHSYERSGTYNVIVTTSDANFKLTYLSCNWGQLTRLDVSAATALTTLHCSNNQLTSLDLSANAVLQDLFCPNNQLTSLDLSANTSLTHLDCYSNQLTSLDVSANTSLTSLDCGNNQLRNLDVSSNTSLTLLDCTYNRLTSLNVSGATALTNLWCISNQLASLNLITNTKLVQLDCSYNQLTNLNLNVNTELRYLTCKSNQLTSLNLIANTKLNQLNCSSNQLINLNINANTVLTTLYCENNQLVNLNVSTHTTLRSLVCHSNKLTSLNVSADTALTYLLCYDNSLPLSDLYAASMLISDDDTKRFGTQTHDLQSVVLATPYSLAGEMNFNGIQTEFSVRKNDAAAVENEDYSIDYSVETISFLTSGSYKVTMTNSAITSLLSYSAQVIMNFEVNTSGIDHIKNNNIFIYPNPTSDLLNINLENHFEPVQVQIFNTQAQISYEQTVQGGSVQTISIANLSKGIYFMKIGNKHIKLIIQ